MLDQATIIAISGLRDLSPGDDAVIEQVVIDLLASEPRAELRFGGARGSDTVALAAACSIPSTAYRRVILPAKLRNQPREARGIIRSCAHAVEELGLDPRYPESYYARNRRLLEGAHGLLAFSDGGSGGTAFTIATAQSLGVPIAVVQIGGRATGGTAFGALTPVTGFPAPVLVWRPYVSAFRGSDALSDYVRRSKVGYTTTEEHLLWAEMIAGELIARGIKPDLIIPMPRRKPGVPNDLTPLVSLLARRLGAQDGTGVLVRRYEPKDGEMRYARLRFSPEAHAQSMTIDRTKVHGHPQLALVIDNVLTTGGSMGGALRTLLNQPVAVSLAGFALLGAAGYQPR